MSDIDLVGDWEDDDDDFNFPEDELSLPISKEQIWEAILNLNISGKNWIFNKMKKLVQ